MVPLTNYLEKNQNVKPSTMVYLYSRYASLFTLMASLSSNNKKMETMLFNKSDLSLAFTSKVMTKISGVSEVQNKESLMKTVEAMSKEYISETNENYIRSGSYIEGSQLLQGDLVMCGSITENIMLRTL
jgi:hypothetical protein|tara:strand:+ start:6567 stop:6953 length:387 start_codon:yes stop_codon:yes gene_type:complete